MQRVPKHTDTRTFDENAALAVVIASGITSSRNGDDCAVMASAAGSMCMSVDTAIAGSHLHESLSAWQMGYRAAACALSDVYAMGAQACHVLCAIGVPPAAWQHAPQAVAGVAARAREASADVVGGDLVAADRWIFSITCTGSAPGTGTGGYVARTGAVPGDAVYVTGTLGNAAAGLERIKRHNDDYVDMPTGGNRYLAPPQRARAARVLARHASAMLDVSDGIATDARRLAAASSIGLRVDLDTLPIEHSTSSVLSRNARDPVLVAATWGDDYELLLTAPPDQEPQMRQQLALVDPLLRFTRIGSATSRDVVFTRHGAPVHDLHGFVHG